MASTTYQVQGMTCGHCVGAVSSEISKITGVSDVAIDLATGRVTVTADRLVEDAAVRTAVEEAGYQMAGS